MARRSFLRALALVPVAPILAACKKKDDGDEPVQGNQDGGY